MVKKKGKKVDKAEQGKRQTTITHEFLAMYPNILEKAKFDDGKEEYCITMLFPKKVNLKKPAPGEKYSLHDIIHNAAAAEWGEDEDQWPEDLEFPFRDGDTDKKKKDDANYKGFIFLKAKNKNRQPGLVDRNREEITDPEELYSGCYCRAQVYAYAYDTSGNVGVSLIVHNVQKIRDGERIETGYQSAVDAFSVIEDDDTEETEDEDEEDEPRSKKSKSKSKPSKSKSRDEDEDDSDDEDEDEDEKPKKSSKPKSKKKVVEEDEDDELIEDDDDLPPPPKKKSKK